MHDGVKRIDMSNKNDRHGVAQLIAAVGDLSNFAMATATAGATAPLILNPSANPNAAVASKWPNDPSSIDKYNWLLHVMYARGESDRIQQFIRSQTRKNAYMTYVQGLVLRQEGRIVEALEYFQRCVVEYPTLTNIKQVAKTLALLGRYRVAIDAYKEALTRTNSDWEIYHNLGLCYMQLREFPEAKESFLQALQVSEMQEASYLALGRVHLLEGSRDEAENVFERGARRNPESPALFTEIGLLAFQRSHYAKAFECFGTALTFSPTHIPAIMAACQVIQKHGDPDVALSKYRIVYGRKPECAQVWNNIGMCFFSKKKFVAAISCLKRANYLAPFELYVLYNLGLVHLYLQQYASAAIFLQSAIRLNRKHAPSYALLGVTLAKLNDPENASRAYAQSLKLDPTDPMTLLNYAILQINTGVSQSKVDQILHQFHQCYEQRAASMGEREIDQSMKEIANKLSSTTTAVIHSSATPSNLDADNGPSADLPSPRKFGHNDQNEEEPPTIRTKIYDDGRHRSRRTKANNPSMDNENVQNNTGDLSAAF